MLSSKNISRSRKKELVHVMFQDVYEFVQEISENSWEGYKPFTISAPHDGKAIIHMLGRGGIPKKVDHFCSYCSISSSNIDRVRLQSSLCRRCCECPNVDVPCRHWDLHDKEYISSCARFLEEESADAYFKEGWVSKINSLPQIYLTATRDSHEKPDHIDFDFVHSSHARNIFFFTDLIVQHIRARQEVGISFNVTISDDINENKRNLNTLVFELRRRLEYESLLRDSQCTINLDSIGKTSRLIEAEKLIYDLMHLGNRTSERIVKIILVFGSENHSIANQASFRGKVTDMVNSAEFRVGDISEGQVIRPHDGVWEFPEGDAGDPVGEIKMSAVDAKKFMEKIELLYDICLPEDTPDRKAKRELFASLVIRYKRFMMMLEKREDFTDDDLEEIEAEIARFAEEWIRCTGNAGLTTYFHYLISGHVMYFARRYRNYYRYMQQGWEAINARVKNFFSHHTQKSGHGSDTPSFLRPIYLYFLRSYEWRSGIGEKFFRNNVIKQDTTDEEGTPDERLEGDFKVDANIPKEDEGNEEVEEENNDKEMFDSLTDIIYFLDYC